MRLLQCPSEESFASQSSQVTSCKDSGTKRPKSALHMVKCQYHTGLILYARKGACAWQDENARAGSFGFEVDNTIGGTPQPNGWADDWVAFYREHRLLHQLRLANDAALSRMGERLAAHLGRFFEGVKARANAVMFGVFVLGGRVAGTLPCALPAAPAVPGQQRRDVAHG